MHRTTMAAPRHLGFAALLAFLFMMTATATGAEISTEKVSDFTLPNGLEVVVIPDHRAPVVTHMVWYKAGAADEAPGKSGIAHFFEHLMFKGTTKHPGDEFEKKVAEIGGEQNAFTSYDYTAFYEEVAPPALKEMMAFEADRMRNLDLSQSAIDTERKVVMEERRMRVDNNPQAVLNEAVEATLFENSPYRFPVIGWMHEIKALDRKEAIAFYDRYYEPNNAVVVVAGDVTPEAVRKMAEETYGSLPRGPALPPRERPTEPVQRTARTVTLHDPRVTVPTFQTYWVVPSYNTAKPGEAEALDVLAEILGGGERSRLYQSLVVKKGVAVATGAFYQGSALDDFKFAVYGSPIIDKTTIGGLHKAVIAELDRIRDKGVSADELAKAKKRLVRGMIFARDNPSGMARIYGTALTTGSSVKDVEEWPDRIDKVTAEQVKAVADEYLDPAHSVTGYLLPTENGKS